VGPQAPPGPARRPTQRRGLLLALAVVAVLCGGARADAPPEGDPVVGTSWRTRDGRLRALYLPRFVPAAELAAQASAFGLAGVDLGVDASRGRLVLSGADDAVDGAREALSWLDVPLPEALVTVGIVETVRRERRQAGGSALFDRDAAGGPDTFFRGLRTAFEPEDWLRSELLGTASQGTSLGFGDDGSALGGAVEGVLRLLAHQGEAEFLAEPSLACTQGVPAAVEASVLLPVSTFRRVGADVTRGFVGEKAGVRLEVHVEHVGADAVTLRVHPWLRQVAADASDLGPEGVPVLAVREMDTRITVADGETVLVGGLDVLRRARTRDAVPGAAAATGLDGLLSSSAVEGERSEVLFLVRVRILTPGRTHGGTTPPGEAERLLRRGTRARLLPR
jgi:type II secretory pathway component GspD/PulD (secretin)